MINTARNAFLVALLCISHIAMSENIITFFIRPYPIPQEATQEDLASALRKPGKLLRKLLASLIEVGHYQGVVASYMGYVTVSDFSGQVTFPRLHQEPIINLLITPLVEPVMMIGATVHHLEILPSLPAKMYTIARKQDQDTGIFYWDAQEAPLPESNRISLNTIILFTKPDAIIVPKGVTITDNSPMLVLPDIYATRELNVAIEALRILKIRHFFGKVHFNYTKQTDVDYAKQLVP